MRQIGRPVYGVQFHPEGYTESTTDRKNLLATAVYGDAPAPHEPDGRRLLANFFRIAGLNLPPE